MIHFLDVISSCNFRQVFHFYIFWYPTFLVPLLVEINTSLVMLFSVCFSQHSSLHESSTAHKLFASLSSTGYHHIKYLVLPSFLLEFSHFLCVGEIQKEKLYNYISCSKIFAHRIGKHLTGAYKPQICVKSQSN